MAAPVSRFVNLRETEAEREQPVLLAHRLRARKAEALAQPQHRLEALDGAPRCVEGLEAADPRHGLVDEGLTRLERLLAVSGYTLKALDRLKRDILMPSILSQGSPLGATAWG